MIKEGVLDNPKVDAALALHIDSTIPTGCISVRSGPNIGGVTAINIKVKGKGGHFALPHETVDPIVVGAHVIVGLQSMVARQVNHWEPFVLTFGQFLGGTRDNVIPEEVVIRGDMAAINNELRENTEQNIERLVKGVTASFGASAEVQFWRGYPTLENDPGIVEMVREVAASITGKDRVLAGEPSLVGEDFAFFAQRVPAAMWLLGAWDKNKHKEPTRHHDPKFDIDEACLPLGIELMASSALEYLFKNIEAV
jgi:amidohydrolase